MYCVTFGRAGKIYSISMSKFSIPTDGKKRREKNWTFFFFKFVNAMLVTNIRLRVVPHFSSGTVERAWKSPHARQGDMRRVTFSRVGWFSRTLALLSLRKNGGLLVVYKYHLNIIMAGAPWWKLCDIFLITPQELWILCMGWGNFSTELT